MSDKSGVMCALIGAHKTYWGHHRDSKPIRVWNDGPYAACVRCRCLLHAIPHPPDTWYLVRKLYITYDEFMDMPDEG